MSVDERATVVRKAATGSGSNSTMALEGEVDLGNHLDGEIFEPLRDPHFFAEVRLDPELRTIAWPNGADLAPEFLRTLVHSRVAA